MEVLQFIFSSFWVWSGSVVMLALIAVGLSAFTPFAGLVTIRKGEE